MTIADSLLLLNNTKQSIKSSIENKGVTVGAAPFADYAGLIDSIPAGIEIPNIGDEFGGGYFVGLLYLSDGIFANIISPTTGGSVGNFTMGTLAAWESTPEMIDPREAMNSITTFSQAKNAVEGLSLNGHSDWMFPSYLQSLQYSTEASLRGWSGEMLETVAWWVPFENPGNSQQVFKGTAPNDFSSPPAMGYYRQKNTNGRVRAFRIEKLADLP